MAAVALLCGCGEDAPPSLAGAADKAAAKSSRGRVEARVDDTEGQLHLKGTFVSAAQGQRMLLKVAGNDFAGKPARLELRVIDGDIWSSRGRRWKLSRGPLASPISLTPAEFFAYLRAAHRIKEVGREPVLGADTTHYRARISIDKLAAAEGGELLAEAMRVVEPSAAIPIEAWIDRRGLPIRIRIDWREAEHDALTMDMLVDAYDVPVEVKPPRE